MRQLNHNTMAKFRADDRLIAAAQAQARREGTSLSAVVRRALEREVQAA